MPCIHLQQLPQLGEVNVVVDFAGSDHVVLNDGFFKDGEPVGEQINRTLESVTWQVSMNFGRGQGWSYVTVGSGLFSFDTYLGDGPGDGPGSTTLNVGGGARWFKWKHAGFTADMRFYMTKDAGGTTLVAPRGSKRIVVLSVGLSVK